MHDLLKKQTFSFPRECCGGGLEGEREEQGSR